MNPLRRFAPIASATLALSVASCDPAGESFDRTTLLSTTSSAVIVPTYASLAVKSSALLTATQAFCTTQDAATLDAMQLAWSETIREYEVAQAFAFGPYRTSFYEEKLDAWPVDVTKVEAVINGTQDLTFLAPVEEGLSVFEYLTFDPAAGDAAILAAFADTTHGARRCAYATQIATDAAKNAGALRDAWTSGFQSAFDGAGAGSAAYTTPGAAIADLVNHLVFACQDAREMRLGATMGRPGGVGGDMLGHPALAESRFSDRSVQDLLDTLDGIEAIYRGGFGAGPTPAGDAGQSGLGLRDYLLTKKGGADADAVILAQIDAARTAVGAITPSLREAATPASGASGPASGEAAIQAAYDAIRLLETRFTTDLAGALAVTIVFNDTDGD